MSHKKRSRIDLEINLSKPYRNYNWEKLLSKEILLRNQWLAQVWGEVYLRHQHDEEIRFLSTEDMMKTKWFEKYGYKEPNFRIQK